MPLRDCCEEDEEGDMEAAAASGNELMVPATLPYHPSTNTLTTTPSSSNNAKTFKGKPRKRTKKSPTHKLWLPMCGSVETFV